MNIKLHIEYIGTNYFGWQKQGRKKTIQSEIEKNLFKIYKKKITLIGSGRTDSGVHALNQIANFHIDENNLNLIALRNKLNQLLNLDIRIKECSTEKDAFHSQHSCKKKTYLYKIKASEPCSVFELDRLLYIKKDLNLDKMKEFCSYFLGEKDFKFFCKSGYSGSSTYRTIYSFKLSKKKNMFEVKITGNGFLRGMVRLIIGALLNYEKGKISKNDVLNALDGKKALKINFAVPACGLYLYNVKY